jgi:haloalkane dehalogenase
MTNTAKNTTENTTTENMKRLRVPGGEMAYLDVGRGDPVLLIHGTPSSSLEWRHVVRALAPRYRVLAPDHLGFGASERPSDWRTYSLPWHTSNLRAWIDALQLPRFHLVVHDFGGPIALPLVLDAPHRLLSLTIVQSWLWDLGAPSMDNPLMRWLYLSGNFSARMMVKMSWGKRTKLTADLHRQFKEQFPDRASRAGTWGFARSVSHERQLMDDQGTRLEALKNVPVLLVWGKADKLVRPQHLERWKTVFPTAQVLELDDVGHFPQIEAPDDLIAALDRRLAT